MTLGTLSVLPPEPVNFRPHMGMVRTAEDLVKRSECLQRPGGDAATCRKEQLARERERAGVGRKAPLVAVVKK